SRARKGQDLLHSIEITLEDAAKGVKKEFILEKSEQCASCGGTGADGGELSSCPDCSGTGYVRSTRRTAFGIFSSTTACRRCGGTGSIAKKPCRACNGNGYAQKRKNIEVDIPAGIESGANLRVAGEGEAGARGGRAGDLYITVHVKPHDFFTRRGNDIFCKVSIPFATAALGGESEVPTIEGTASIKIPSGTQSGSSFRLRGKGMPIVGRYGSGDEYVEVVIKVPSTLSRQEREALERFRDLSFEK
ncbi:MAG: molecular chaperone DnaJ, partial [Candidatus Woesearchaeota archaeon]|nr:molecular chaperone DnaJ [Candidatus Woesearchaeota archaeon]